MRVGGGLADEAEQPVQPEASALGQQQKAQLQGLQGVGMVCLNEL